uniref:Uncharacterized protein n=1 Tax=Romanomermis culicivorax TaxID=13658 RepID=A0A915K8F9_ROMCU
MYKLGLMSIYHENILNQTYCDGEDGVDIRMHQEVGANYALIIVVVVEDDAFDHMLFNGRFHGINDWASLSCPFGKQMIGYGRGPLQHELFMANQTILGLTMVAADAVSLEGITILAIEVG